ncbi:hypothetical protein C8R41DRAFT_917648 [Lentinula lateritia]|uniref:C2H2-type domain-containing protein n=1 Tax=Lentinula lateritia TaxID=40482 RepID=A0ABQ8VPE0_9AGAR|nr:hypothetical protein C8R41DRAFT_917648 [Lentinula lateritia]
MSNNSYTCSGCGQNYNRSSDLIQHLEKTSRPACQKAHEASKQAIHHSRFVPQVDPLIHNYSQFPSSSSGPHLTSQDEENKEDEEDKENEEEDPIHPFQETGVDDEDEDVSMQDVKSLLRHLPAHREEIHIEQFGGQAGAIVVEQGEEQTLPIFHDSKDGFLHYEAHIPGIKENKWAPFASRMDWEIARWAKLRGTGSTAFSE